MLLPSTITARRTRRYTSTLYIRRTIQGVGYNPYGWRRTVQFATAVCQRLPARTGQFTSAAYTLAQRRKVLDDVNAVAAYAKEMKDFLEESELTERRAFIETFVKEILVVPGDALMRYTVPMPDDSRAPGKATEKVALPDAVLSTVHDGGPDWDRTTAPRLERAQSKTRLGLRITTARAFFPALAGPHATVEPVPDSSIRFWDSGPLVVKVTNGTVPKVYHQG